MIVVTGSAGYLGSRIVTSLLCAGPVSGIDRAEAPTVTHRADILDGATLRRAFRGARAVIHTAGLNGGPGAPALAGEMPRINVGGTDAVIAAARDAGVRRLVLTSTTALYGGAIRPAEAAIWVTEDLPPAPETPYEASKRDAEALVLAAAGSFPDGCVILRCGRFFPAPPNETVNDRLYRGVDPRDVAAAHILAADRTDGSTVVLNIAAATPSSRAPTASSAGGCRPRSTASPPSMRRGRRSAMPRSIISARPWPSSCGWMPGRAGPRPCRIEADPARAVEFCSCRRSPPCYLIFVNRAKSIGAYILCKPVGEPA
jgi:UDP-glucose 4-epimerase